jgi:hypothetical protein
MEVGSMAEERARGRARYVDVSKTKLNWSLPILVNHHSSARLGLLAWFLA